MGFIKARSHGVFFVYNQSLGVKYCVFRALKRYFINESFRRPFCRLFDCKQMVDPGWTRGGPPFGSKLDGIFYIFTVDVIIYTFTDKFSVLKRFRQGKFTASPSWPYPDNNVIQCNELTEL